MKIKWMFMLLITMLVIFTACNDGVERTIEEDQADLQAYLSENSITVEPTESGLYYIESNPGTRFPVQDGEFIIFQYTLKTITGQLLAEDAEYWIDASAVNVITGLAEGISLMKEGAEATIIIPPELAYGQYGKDDIEGNMTLIFDVKVTEVKGPEEEKIRLQEFIDDSGIGVEPRASGLYFIDVDSGNGLTIQANDNLLVKYTGKLLDGTVFDQTQGVNYFDYNYLGTDVIAGFEEGVGLMKHGGKATLIIPYDLAYGEGGSSKIYPYSSLIFEVELVSLDD